jgi:hypothetical protein
MPNRLTPCHERRAAAKLRQEKLKPTKQAFVELFSQRSHQNFSIGKSGNLSYQPGKSL